MDFLHYFDLNSIIKIPCTVTKDYDPIKAVHDLFKKGSSKKFICFVQGHVYPFNVQVYPHLCSCTLPYRYYRLSTIDCPQVSNITRFNCSGTGWTDLEKP